MFVCLFVFLLFFSFLSYFYLIYFFFSQGNLSFSHVKCHFSQMNSFILVIGNVLSAYKNDKYFRIFFFLVGLKGNKIQLSCYHLGQEVTSNSYILDFHPNKCCFSKKVPFQNEKLEESSCRTGRHKTTNHFRGEKKPDILISFLYLSGKLLIEQHQLST